MPEKETPGTLAAALLAVQREMPAIEKDAVNPHFKNQYVSLDRLLAVALPILHKHGIVLVQEPRALFPDGLAVVPALTTRLIHAASGECQDATMPLILDKENSQGVGSAITYGRRYMLAAMLGVSGEKDDDGNLASAEPKKAKKVPPASQEPPSQPAVPRGMKMRLRIEELAREADKMREKDGGTTWAEIVEVVRWKGEQTQTELSWDSLSEDDLSWLGGELKDYVAAGNTGLSFYDHVSVPF